MIVDKGVVRLLLVSSQKTKANKNRNKSKTMHMNWSAIKKRREELGKSLDDIVREVGNDKIIYKQKLFRTEHNMRGNRVPPIVELELLAPALNWSLEKLAEELGVALPLEYLNDLSKGSNNNQYFNSKNSVIIPFMNINGEIPLTAALASSMKVYDGCVAYSRENIKGELAQDVSILFVDPNKTAQEGNAVIVEYKKELFYLEVNALTDLSRFTFKGVVIGQYLLKI